MEEIQKKIGEKVKSLRKLRQLSLDQAAIRTGVSKAMLGQIERGESSPTVTTLWKIATGFQVSFSSLIQEEESNISIVRKDSVTPIRENDDKYRVYSIFPFDARKKFEVFLIELLPGCHHISEPHPEGVEEYITVMEGSLTIEFAGEEHEIRKGESLRFVPNQTHTYQNKGSEVVQCHMIIYYP
ncbi:XRE family transcriptional regulator [Bacillus oleivorans]|uniref:XRE family transcriptional regulator n=1 Tax=Bacillus oleivorans TaxID=1448271 RepID=A0A285CR37_9BACI|nr:XRE family transcriptional regulator [Bacillus oleivorans]SNX70039.1 XRE family transcriptional regulator [Bacillus oleivorans]